VPHHPARHALRFALMLLTGTVYVLTACGAPAEDLPGVRVDLSQIGRPVTRRASGSTWGLSETGPSDAILADLRMATFRQPASLNGENRGWGATHVIDRALAHGGHHVEAVLADLLPGYPPEWPGQDEWLARVRTFALAKAAADRDALWYDVWDEPDRRAPEQWAALGGFPAVWKATVDALRAADPRAVVVGPSHSAWSREAYRALLTDMRDGGTLPEVVSWHETAGAATIEAHVAEYRALVSELGIDERPVSINAYMSADEQGAAGPLVAYLAALERARVAHAAIAHWHDPGTLGRVVAGSQPLAGYWVLRWYAEMSGRMAATEPLGVEAGLADAVACVDASASSAVILAAGTRVRLVVRGLEAVAGLIVDGHVHARVERVPQAAFAPVRTPILVGDRDLDVVDGTLELTLPLEGWDAGRVVLSSPSRKHGGQAERGRSTPGRQITR
jgi:hypothetical protein